MSFQTGDFIDGAGGTDQLNLRVVDATANNLDDQVVEMVNIENVFVRNLGGNDAEVDATLWTGVEQFWNDRSSTDNVEAANVQGGLAAGVRGTGTDLEITYADDVLGDDYTQTIVLDGANDSTVTINVGGDDEISGVAINVLNDSRATLAGAVEVAGGGDLEEVTVSGEGNLRLDGVAASAFDSDADDRISIDGTDLDGTLSLYLTALADGDVLDLRDASGVDALWATTTGAAGDEIFVNRLTSDTTIGFGEDWDNDNGEVELNLAAGNSVANIALEADAGTGAEVGTITSANARMETLNIASVEGSAAGDSAIDVISVASLTALNVSAEDDADISVGTIDGGNLETITVSGEGDVHLGDATAEENIESIDLSEHTGLFEIELDDAEDRGELTVTFGEGNADIDLGAFTGATETQTFVFTSADFETIDLDFGAGVVAANADLVVLDFTALGIDMDDLEFDETGGGDATIEIDGGGTITLTGISQALAENDIQIFV